ncbi:MAG: Fic family protein [Methanomicrobiales archaeon]|nr:Fic family protein [Methanomicrobiales archaeon]
MIQSRMGVTVRQKEGYQAYIPKSLPPDPPVIFDNELHHLLSEADRALARLDGMTIFLPNADLFVAMYVKKEALLSAQIEGTQASLQGVLEFEADMVPGDDINEIKEVINYIQAMDYGLGRTSRELFSIDIMQEVHRILIEGTRGSKKKPGKIRAVQNWIGPAGSTIYSATFVPPPPEKVQELLSGLEQFVLADDRLPPLIKIALVHAQFETIHPFIDGNGRMGRLLITFYLCFAGILARPLLYLSIYLKQHRSEYYQLLQEIRFEGDWESWIKFFLKGIIEVSNGAMMAAREIITLKGKLIEDLVQNNVGGLNSVRLLDLLFSRPVITVTDISKTLKISHQPAYDLVDQFLKLGILREITGKKRYKRYLFIDYVGIIEKGTAV